MWDVDKKFLNEKGIKIFSGKNADEIINYISEKAGEKSVYISFDIDVFDSSIVNATGYAEEKGLMEKEGLELVKKFVDNFNVRVFDLVEFNPEKGDKGKEICIKILRIINEKS